MGGREGSLWVHTLRGSSLVGIGVVDKYKCLVVISMNTPLEVINHRRGHSWGEIDRWLVVVIHRQLVHRMMSRHVSRLRESLGWHLHMVRMRIVGVRSRMGERIVVKAGLLLSGIGELHAERSKGQMMVWHVACSSP